MRMTALKSYFGVGAVQKYYIDRDLRRQLEFPAAVLNLEGRKGLECYEKAIGLSERL